MDTSVGIASLLIIVGILVVLFLVFRQIVLWYFRINERTELLRDIRDSLRQGAAARAWQPDARPVAPTAAVDEVRRRPGESEDQFNSRVADQLQRQLRS